MKNFTRLFSILIAAILACVACNDMPPQDAEPPVVTIEESVLATAEGVEYSVRYTIANPVSGETLKVTEDVEWVDNVVVTADAITFTVAANEGEARETTLNVDYINTTGKTIKVMQEAKSGGETPKPAEAFSIYVEELHASTAITQVTPGDEEMYYIMYLEEVSYFQDHGIDTAEKLLEDDFAAFEGNAVNYGMNLREYLISANIAFKGVTRVQWSSLLPGVKSVLYVYGIKFSEDGASYEAVTEVAWSVLEPEYAPLKDIKFALDVKVDGADVALSITPENFDGHYLVKFVDANDELYVADESVFTDEYMETIAQEWIWVYDGNLSNGFKTEDILKNTTYSGEQVVEVELASYVLYSAIVYAVEEYDGFVQVVSKPSYVNFSTEEVKPSNLSFDIEVTNNYVRVADLHVVPSNPDEQYALLLLPTEYLPAEYDDDVLIDLVLNTYYYAYYQFKGEISTHLNTLYPDYEYMVIVFGYSGGVVTTEVCIETFKTQPEGVCELSITDVKIGGPYLPSDLYNYDPERFKYYISPYCSDNSFFALSMEVETSSPTEDIFVMPFAQIDFDGFGEDVIFFDLLIEARPKLEITTKQYANAPYYVCAAAFDYKGNVTPMWKSELINWTRDDIKPVDELVAKLEANPSAQILMVNASTGEIVPVR